jgi:predicted transcriptional regulator
MKYRSQIDIFASILELATEKGVRLTKLMYLTFTSHKQIKQFLKLLIDNGMLEYDNKQRFYRATKKGLRYLELYREMGELVKINSMNM